MRIAKYSNMKEAVALFRAFIGIKFDDFPER